MFGSREVSETAAGCPIAAQQFQQVPSGPQHRAQKGKEPREAMRPVGEVTQVTQQHIDPQRHPHLPAHRVGVVAQEIRQLQRLLDLFEKHFDLPPAAIEISHGARTPVQVVGQKGHFSFLTIDFNQGHDAAHQLGGGLVRVFELDDFIPQHLVVLGAGHLLDDLAGQVLLGASDPMDAALIQIPQMAEVHVTLVQQGDFAALEISAQFPGAFVVVLRSGVHDDESRQQALQVQSHVGFGSGFAPAMFGPIHRVGHQFHRRAVDDVNGHLETEGGPASPARREPGRLFLQVRQRPPKKLLGHLGGTLPVGVGQTVAAGRRRATHGGQRPGVQLERVAQVVQSDAMSQLRVAQTDRVTPGTERARLVLHAGLPCDPGNLVLGNEIADLTQNVKPAACWLGCFLFHPCPVAGLNGQANTFFPTACGMAVFSFDLPKYERQRQENN